MSDCGVAVLSVHALRHIAIAFDAITQVTEQMKMNRNLARYKVRWKIAVIFRELEHQPTFHGKCHDLTLVGTGMLTDKDVFSESPLVVLLAIPPLHRSGHQKVIEINARQIYSVYSGETSCFRLGLEFREFKRDGFEILKEALSHRNAILQAPSYDPFPTVFGRAESYQPDRNLDLAA